MKSIKYFFIIAATIIIAVIYFTSNKEVKELKEYAVEKCVNNIPDRDLSSRKPLVGLSFNSDFMIDSIYHIFEVDGKQYTITASAQPFVLVNTPVDSISYKNLNLYYPSDYNHMVEFIAYVYCTTYKEVHVSDLMKYIDSMSPSEFWDLYWECMRIEGKRQDIMKYLCNHVVYLFPTESNTSIDAIKLNRIGAISNIYLNNYVNICLEPRKEDDSKSLTKKFMSDPDFSNRRIYDKWSGILNYNNSSLIEEHYRKAQEDIVKSQFIVAAVDEFYLGFPEWNTSSLEKKISESRLWLSLVFVMLSILIINIGFDVNSYNENKRRTRILNEKRAKCFNLIAKYPNAYKSLGIKKELSEEVCNLILQHEEEWYQSKESEIITIREKRNKERELARALTEKQEKEASAIIKEYRQGYEAWFKEILSTKKEALINNTKKEIDNARRNKVIAREEELLHVKSLLEKEITEDIFRELIRLIKFPGSRIIENKNQIVNLNKQIIIEKNNKKWNEEQTAFTLQECKKWAQECLDNFHKEICTLHSNKKGYYLQYLSLYKHFYCPDIEIDCSEFPMLEMIRNKVPSYMNGTEVPNIDSCIEPISNFIEQIANKYYENDDSITVLLNNEKEGWDSNLLYQYLKPIGNYLIAKDPNRIEVIDNDTLFVENWDGEGSNVLNADKIIVVIDLVTSENEQFQLCNRILEYEKDKNILIVCISIIKEMESVEMQSKINLLTKIKEQYKKAQEEKEIAQKELVNNAMKWTNIIGTIHHSYLINYFPTTCEFDANQKEWNDRNLIWDFKNDPEKILPEDHNKAIEKLIPMLKKHLVETFGEKNLHYLTLVCIPASTKVNNKLRFEDFSNRLCKETGMKNSYSKIVRETDKLPKHLGGSSNTLEGLKFDEVYFKGKYVLIFDDVLTKSESVRLMDLKLRKMGAVVVGCLTIGKTKHTRDE